MWRLRQMEPPTRHVPDDQSESPGNTACQAQEGNALEGGDSQKEMMHLESVRVLAPIKQWDYILGAHSRVVCSCTGAFRMKLT